MKIVRIITNTLFKINFKTIKFNFHYLPFKEAVKFPFYVSKYAHLRELKGSVIIDKKIKTFQIRLGVSDVGIFEEKDDRFIWQVSGKVVFRGVTFLGIGCKISVAEGAELIFGERVKITALATIIAHKKIEIGNHSLLSWNILIMDTDFHKLIDEHNNIINNPAEIYIGEHVWIGCNCTILKKAKIANNTVVAASTLVNSLIEGENQLIGGQPCRIIRQNIRWEN